MTKLEEFFSLWTFKTDTKPLENVKTQIEQISLAATAVAGVVAAGAATIFGFVKTTANAADAAFDMAKKVGVSSEELQKFQYAAKLSGSDAESMTNAFRFLSRNIAEAAGGNKELAKSFNELGISLYDSNGQLSSADVVFKKLADRFKTLPEGPLRTKVAMDLLGRSGADMIQLLGEGSEGIDALRKEAEDLGFVLGDDAGKSGREFNDTMDRLGFLLAGLRNTIGTALLPVMQEFLGEFIEFVKLNRELITMNIKQFLQGTVSVIKGFAAAVSRVVKFMGGWENSFRIMLQLFAAFAAAKILFTIGQLAVGFVSFAKSIDILTLAFKLMNLQALLIPALWAGLAVLIALIAEDIYGFFNGKESITGELIEQFKVFFNYLSEQFNKLGDGAKTFIAVITTPFRVLIAMLRTVGDLIAGARGAMSLGEMGKNLVDRTKNIFGAGTTDSLSGSLGLAPSSGDVARENFQQSMNVDSPITVNIGPTDNPLEIGRAVKGGVEQGMGPLLRQTQRGFQGKTGEKGAPY